MNLGIFAWRGVLLAGAGVLAWISLGVGLGEMYAERVAAGDETLIDHALGWQPEHSGMLFGKAAMLQNDDPQRSLELLRQAYAANPSDPRPLILRAGQLREAGAVERSDALIELAARLTPVDSRMQLQFAAYWGERGQLERMLKHVSTTLEADPSKRSELFPSLLAMAESAEYRALLAPLAQSPPSWWKAYFTYVAAKAQDVDAVRFLYALRRQATRVPLQPEEREAFVRRLQQDGLVDEAYLVWISGLDDNARKQLGFLYDGGFERPIDGSGFGWRVARHKHFSGTTAPTRGVNGRAALRLRFRAFEGRFRHVTQPLLLAPGAYQLLGRLRLDSLTSKGGVRWTVRCLLPDAKVLAEGPRLLGSSDWREFEFSFEVPNDCRYQQLLLASGGTRAFERKLDGVVWFDDMRIRRVEALDAAARVDALMRAEANAEREHDQPVPTEVDDKPSPPE